MVNTKISAQVVADSLAPNGDRLTTMLITFPRFILAELNTHRMLSKNSASSRAIPFHKMVEAVQNNPFVPIAWQKDHKGMQGTEYVTDKNKIEELEAIWLYGRDHATNTAETLHSDEENDVSVTKQLCNRLLEPFMWHTVLISGTEWENFFALRCPQYEHYDLTEDIPKTTYHRSKKDWIKYSKELELKKSNVTTIEPDWLSANKGQAEIHMMALAEAMWDAYNESKPKQLVESQWHIPFIDDKRWDEIVTLYASSSVKQATEAAIKIGTAMAARTSYTVVGEEKEISYETLIGIHDRMANADPFHASPFEHCARVMTNDEYYSHVKGHLAIQKAGRHLSVHEYGDNPESYGWCRNYRGFIQYRHLIENK